MIRAALVLVFTLLPLTSLDAATLHTTMPTGVLGPPAVSRPAHPTAARTPRSRQRQTVAPAAIRVHDGDTFYVGAQTIRLHGIDTPELGQPRADAARRRLIALLGSGTVTIVPRAEDVYGRTVADVFVGGRNVAAILTAEGFAKPHPPRIARSSKAVIESAFVHRPTRPARKRSSR